MEELKVVMAALAQLGAAGKEAFIWWLVFDKLLYVVGWLAGLWMVGQAAWRLSSIGSSTEKLRDAMGVGCSGPVVGSELKAMFDWIEKAKSKRYD